jgi:Protein of unknown function DUF262
MASVQGDEYSHQKEPRGAAASAEGNDMKHGPQRELQTVTVKHFVDDYVYRIDLDADYQREKIWSRKNQEELLDSILQNIDIPKLYLVKTRENESFDYECIDGKQRMNTLLSFYKPDPTEESPLTLRVAGEKLTYKRLQKTHPTIAKRIDDFQLSLVVYDIIEDDDFIREIFRRLQLGIRLNSGELLNSLTGAMRDFIFKEMGKDAPFLRNTKLSEKRFSRQFTLAQICINSFNRSDTGQFVRARFEDLQDFFKDNYGIEKSDKNLRRIQKMLGILDKGFGERASVISSRAVAVTVYLYAEEHLLTANVSRVRKFADFMVKLLDTIKDDLARLSRYQSPKNRFVLDNFQKHVTQASVEPFAIKRRHQFVQQAFTYYLKSKGKIVS